MSSSFDLIIRHIRALESLILEDARSGAIGHPSGGLDKAGAVTTVGLTVAGHHHPSACVNRAKAEVDRVPQIFYLWGGWR